MIRKFVKKIKISRNFEQKVRILSFERIFLNMIKDICFKPMTSTPYPTNERNFVTRKMKWITNKLPAEYEMWLSLVSTIITLSLYDNVHPPTYDSGADSIDSNIKFTSLDYLLLDLSRLECSFTKSKFFIIHSKFTSTPS